MALESRGDRSVEVSSPQAGQPGRWRSVPGWSAIGLSALLWVGLPAIPFLPLSLGARASVAAAALVIAEVLFWLGLLLVGPAMAVRIRAWLRGLGARNRPGRAVLHVRRPQEGRLDGLLRRR